VHAGRAVGTPRRSSAPSRARRPRPAASRALQAARARSSPRPKRDDMARKLAPVLGRRASLYGNCPRTSAAAGLLIGQQMVRRKFVKLGDRVVLAA
jgi:hypothetical protein